MSSTRNPPSDNAQIAERDLALLYPVPIGCPRLHSELGVGICTLAGCLFLHAGGHPIFPFGAAEENEPVTALMPSNAAFLAGQQPVLFKIVDQVDYLASAIPAGVGDRVIRRKAFTCLIVVMETDHQQRQAMARRRTNSPAHLTGPIHGFDAHDAPLKREAARSATHQALARDSRARGRQE